MAKSSTPKPSSNIATRSSRTAALARLAISWRWPTSRLNDGSRALDEAVRAADLLPEDVDAQIQAANLLVLAGRFADAQDRANAVLQRQPGEVRATVALGNALAGLKDLDGAVAQLEEAIRLDPTRAGSYTNLATLQLNAGRLKEAESRVPRGRRKGARFGADPTGAGAVLLADVETAGSRTRKSSSRCRRSRATSWRTALPPRFTRQPAMPTRRSSTSSAAVDADGSSRARLALAEYYIARSRLPEATAVLQALVSDKKVGPTAKVRLATIDYCGRARATQRPPRSTRF